MKKSVSIVLLATILLQSCVVYQKSPVSITQAHNKGKVLIIDSLNNKTKVNYINKVNESYCIPLGEYKKGTDGKLEGMKQLDIDNIEFYLRDSEASTLRTIGLVALIALIGYGLIGLLIAYGV